MQAVSGAELLRALREGAAGTTFADVSGGELAGGGISVGAHNAEEGCCRQGGEGEGFCNSHGGCCVNWSGKGMML